MAKTASSSVAERTRPGQRRSFEAAAATLALCVYKRRRFERPRGKDLIKEEILQR